MKLIVPSLHYLLEYTAALQLGWSPDNLRGDAAIVEEVAAIKNNPISFVNNLDDLEAKGGPIVLPDGSKVPRLPGFRRWLWDGEFCGSIGFGWQPGTSDLPPHFSGHIGYSVVPWKRRRGYATEALALILPEARGRGLAYVDLTVLPANIPSQKVILANGGRFIEQFRMSEAYGCQSALRFRIKL